MDFYHRAATILDSLDAQRGSIKGLCMQEAQRAAKRPAWSGSAPRAGEGGRFLKVIVEVLKYRDHLKLLLAKTRLMTLEPKLFVAPDSTATVLPSKPKAKTAADVLKSEKTAQKSKKRERAAPSPENLALVMLHDLLFAKRGLVLPKAHKMRKKLEEYKEALDKETEREKRRHGYTSASQLATPLPSALAASIENIGKGKKKESAATAHGEEEGGLVEGGVRWLRVNTLKWTVEEAVEWFENERWELVDDLETLLATAEGKKKVLTLDAHIEPLLALPATVSLPSLPPYLDSRLIAQDKASCMPAWILLAPWLAEQLDSETLTDSNESDAEMEEAEEETPRKKGKKQMIRVLDATAAPGNKTSMASALVGEGGKVVAVERDPNRFKVLKGMLQKAGCKNVTPMNTDFLSIDPDDQKFKNISHILVDPSCSGSGIPSRLDHLLPTEPPAELQKRIQSLSGFQTAILSHALRFSGAKRVVYSTCSIWAEEDEKVVQRILAKKEMQARGWRLESREGVLETWERRGRAEECDGDQDMADSMVRCLPEDGTNGFFVACFVRDEIVPWQREGGTQSKQVEEEVVEDDHEELNMDADDLESPKKRKTVAGTGEGSKKRRKKGKKQAQ